jgi:hypothetical protein
MGFTVLVWDHVITFADEVLILFSECSVGQSW